MKKISEKTLITALVNYKCVGFFGKCMKHFSLQDRARATDELLKRGWLANESMNITPAGDEIIKKHLNLCQY